MIAMDSRFHRRGNASLGVWVITMSCAEKGTRCVPYTLGNDVMSAALEGYAMLKVSGKGAGLDALRQGMSARFTRKAKIKALPASA